MGAKNCPETPRQRMIGMMYLVLTAMLALNVSKDILNSFSIVDEALTTSNQITLSKNNQDYAELNQQKAILGEDKVADAFDKAKQIKDLSNEIVDYIEQFKIKYIEFVETTATNEDGTTKTVAQLTQKDNISKSTNYMMNEGHAEVLKEKILTYRNQLLSFVDENDVKSMSEVIGIDLNKKFKNANGAQESWETHYFEGVIFAAGVTLLNKTIGEIRNAESGILKYVIRSISKDDFKFSDVIAKVIPKSQIVFQGDPYEAEVILAAFDATQAIDVYYRMGTGTMTEPSGTLVRGDDGIGRLKIPTNQSGDFSYTGLVKVTGPDGLPKTYTFNNMYTVMAPSATVAAEKMNVLYAGIDNPVSVSASIPPEKLSISISEGSYTKTSAGKFEVKVPESMVGKTVTINAIADNNGKSQTMGSSTFRVKRVPDPAARIGNFKGGKISKQELLVNSFIFASLGEDFVYDLKWTVNDFQVTFVIKGIEDAPMKCTGNQFSEAVKSKINSCSQGTTIYFSSINASCTSIAGKRSLNDITVILR